MNNTSDPQSEFVEATMALKLLQNKTTEFAETIELSADDAVTYAKVKFYNMVQGYIANGQSVEDSIDAANFKVSQKAAQLGTFTYADVATITDEVENLLHN